MDLFIFDQMTLRKPIYIADTIDLEEDIVYTNHLTCSRLLF